MDILIEASHIAKAFQKKKILQDISLCLHRHECIALLGHNGCGKSTLLKIIAGISTMDAGNIRMKPRIDIQYIPERFPQLAISADEYLMQIGRIQGIPASSLRSTITSLSNDFFISELLGTPLRYLSKGSLQKIGVIQALLRPSDVVLMDEPFNGQDKDSQNVFIQKIKDLKQQGVGIIFACHEPYLVHQLADHVYTIQDGMMIQESVQQIIHRHVHIIIIKQNYEIDREIKDFVLNHYDDEYGTHFIVDAKNSQQTLNLALQKGWFIKGVYHEYNN